MNKHSKAVEHLKKNGFKQKGEFWEKEYNQENLGRFLLLILLPYSFPYDIPTIYVKNNHKLRELPHVSFLSGEICYANKDLLLFDHDRPEDILDEIIIKSLNVLLSGYNGINLEDFYKEFSIYWYYESLIPVLRSLNDFMFTQKRLILDTYLPNIPSELPIFHINDNYNYKLDTLISEFKINFSSNDPIIGLLDQYYGVYVPLTKPIDLVFLHNSITLESLFKIISNSKIKKFKSLLINIIELIHRSIPFFILLSHKTLSGDTRTFYGVYITYQQHQTRYFKHIGTSIMPDIEIQKIDVVREDPEYLFPRTGNDTRLLKSKVLIIGCGAIGSQITNILASIGVGNITIVDHDELKIENIYRHCLGTEYIGDKKSYAMKRYLDRNFKGISTTSIDKKIQEIVVDKKVDFKKYNIIISAIGNENAELLLNDYLKDFIPRVHVWLDPAGIGGHVLVTGERNKSGCYRCLFNSNSISNGNKASFLAPNQKIDKNVTGCSGSFVPFSIIDATEIALFACRKIKDILIGREFKNILYSIFNGFEEDISKTLKPSQRRCNLKPGIYFEDISDPFCPVCGK